MSNIAGDQASLNHRDAVKSDVVSGAGGNGDATSEGGAATEGRRVSSGRDGCGGCAAGVRRGLGCLLVSVSLSRRPALLLYSPIARPATASAGTMYFIDILVWDY